MRTRLNSKGGSVDEDLHPGVVTVWKPMESLEEVRTSICQRFKHQRATMARLVREEVRRGLEPKVLSLSIAVGVTCGVWPIMLTTSLVCGFVDMTARFSGFPLSTVVIQMTNLIMAPLQLALCIPFIHLSEHLFSNHEPTPMSPSKFANLLREDPWHLQHIIVHAVVGWALIAPCIFITVVFFTTRYLNANPFAFKPSRSEVHISSKAPKSPTPVNTPTKLPV